MFFVLGVLGNLATCLVIIKNEYMRTTTNIYLFNLALAGVFSCSFLFIFLHISFFTFLKFLHLQPYSRRPGHLGLGHARRALSYVAAISVDLWRGDFKIDIITIYSWILLYIIISVNLWRGDFKGHLIFGRKFALSYTTISWIKILLYATKIYKLGFIFCHYIHCRIWQVLCDVKVVITETLIYASILTIVAFTIERSVEITIQMEFYILWMHLGVMGN